MTDETIVVETSSGRIRGRRVAAGGFAFLGVPYGEDTAGSNRFRPPRPVVPWAGVKDAFAFGPHCPQGSPKVPAEDPHSIQGLGLPSREDCLVLNVWTPATGSGKRPIMVWLHGGAFAVGSASHPVTDGARLSAFGDVVVVSLNHRLNAFGFLFLDDLADGGIADTANAGLRDIVLALEWIRENASAFGGDASSVTLFGELGGGRKICCLMAMPSAAGLFHRAIVQSGAHTRCVPRELAARFAADLVRFLGIGRGELRGLQAMPADRLHDEVSRYLVQLSDPAIAASGDAGRWILSPIVDGDTLASDPWGASAPEVSRDVALLTGTNKDEAALHLARRADAGRISEAELLQSCRAVLGERAEPVIAAYRSGRPEASPWQLLVAIVSEERRALSNDIAQMKAMQGGAPPFAYYFAWESNHGLLGAAHTMDVPFVFRTVGLTPVVGTRADRWQLAEDISSAWVAFARHGNPSNPRMPTWPSFSAAGRETMILDVPTRVERDPGASERQAFGTAGSRPWKDKSFVAALSRAVFATEPRAAKGE